MRNVTPDIIDELAAELGLPRKQVEQAAMAQFRYAAHIMADDSFRPVWLQYLGTFRVHGRQLRKMRRRQLEGKTKAQPDRPGDYEDIEEWEQQQTNRRK